MTQTHAITETPNFLSSDIDLASPTQIVRILRQTDAQIFTGYLGYPGMMDDEILDCLVDLADRAASTMLNPRGRIVLSGAGTSGRLAMLEARMFNILFKRVNPPLIRYLMAGGNAALIQAYEGAEDDPRKAVDDLKDAINGARDVFYIGITCGMSAPYIAGQMEYMLTRKNAMAVLLGFNPVELARNMPIEGWPYTFRDTARRAEQAPNARILNPILGPEPITGSTRMKSGSATKMLLESLFISAAAMAISREKQPEKCSRKLKRDTIYLFLRCHQEAILLAYKSIAEMAKLIELGGNALRNHGHIYYLGPAGIDQNGSLTEDGNTGILGLIDASECPPTYGADFDDVRGFLTGGWRTLFPFEDTDLSNLGAHYRISIEDFMRDKWPNLSKNDLCVFIGQFEETRELVRQARAKGAKTAVITSKKDKCKAHVTIWLLQPPFEHALGSTLYDLQVKLVLNALTTGAHVLAGKVFGNRMVDLRISNNKLFHRTMGIICDLMKVSPEAARDALLKSIYQTTTLTDAQRNASISECIESAKLVEKVVPKALLLATGKFTCADAENDLRKNPIVRSVIGKHVKTAQT
ncbi:MAG: hypothetical protein WCK47_09890 [bacterium]|nr:hypothetical protein [Candidatus Sumerlaeota bacterium]